VTPENSQTNSEQHMGGTRVTLDDGCRCHHACPDNYDAICFTFIINPQAAIADTHTHTHTLSLSLSLSLQPPECTPTQNLSPASKLSPGKLGILFIKSPSPWSFETVHVCSYQMTSTKAPSVLKDRCERHVHMIFLVSPTPSESFPYVLTPPGLVNHLA